MKSFLFSVIGACLIFCASSCSSDPAGETPVNGQAAGGAGGTGTPALGGELGSPIGAGGADARGGTGGIAANAGSGSDPEGAGGAVGGSTPSVGGSSAGGVASAGSGGAAGGQPQAAGGATGSNEEYPLPDNLPNETGAQLWLRYPRVPIPGRLKEYQAALTHVVNSGDSPTLTAAAEELTRGLSGLTAATITAAAAPSGAGAVVIGTPQSSTAIAGLGGRLTALGTEGYLVELTQVGDQSAIVVAANTDVGVLYGSFALLRYLQSHGALASLSMSTSPKIKNRLLNHWDNLDRSVERGYAGKSLWDWSALPGSLSPRYKDYARACASIGINGAVLTNVNATKNNNEDLWGSGRATYFKKVAALADTFRPYGIRVYLTAPFNAGGTANPKDAATRKWWVDAMNEIYTAIPDFGGLLIKASSEGEPGPSAGATHADGANMLAAAIGDRGIVMWRAFVYGQNRSADRIRQAYDEFKPLDGKFDENVFVQPKNGPLDFQPREPFHPLFGAMPNTPLALELQITQEYLGQDTHLAYLGPMYEEVLKADTYASGAGSTVARVIDGSLHKHNRTAIAGVANVGDDTNWTGSHFNQANWYVYGRMAWDPDLSAKSVAEEWVRQTFSNDPLVVTPVVEMMMASRQHVVDYMTPLGLAHLMATDHHYGPGPWVNDLSTPEWNPFYYHKADSDGIGFDRTSSGSKAVEQYAANARDTFGSRGSVPDDFLLFFHRVGWQEKLGSGKSLWEELVHRYSRGVDGVGTMKGQWVTVKGRIDAGRFEEVAGFLDIQHYEARWWRDACLSYFAQTANLTIPAGYAAPANDLGFYQGLKCPANVTKPRCSQVYTGNPSPAILP